MLKSGKILRKTDCRTVTQFLIEKCVKLTWIACMKTTKY